MNKLLPIFNRCFATVTLLVALTSGALLAQPALAMDKDFIQTNGEDIIIDHNIIIKTNSALNTDEFKQFKWREHELMQLARSGATNTGAMDQFVAGAWLLAKDYPDRVNGYQDIMMAIEEYEYTGVRARAQSLADELIASSAPEKFKAWARGFENRLDSQGKPVTLQFQAVDGRTVDLAQMRGRVVLVDFWGTHCGPCVAELPRVKAAFEKFHDQGFDVIGISCDTDKAELESYIKAHGISWPQYFDGKQQNDNKFTVEFGVDGIPHMFLVDKKGFLRFDNVRASDKYHSKNDTTSLEQKISSLLAEQ